MKVLILSSVLLNCLAQLLVKRGMMGVGEVSGGAGALVAAFPAMIRSLPLWIAGMCYVVSLLLWMTVLSKAEVSYAYPFLSIGYVITAAAGKFIFGENLSPVRIAGILVICAGVVLISRS